jgi:hypothetical protein
MTATIAAAGREWTVDGRQEDWAATWKAAREADRTITATTIDGDTFTLAATAIAWVDETAAKNRQKIGFA